MECEASSCHSWRGHYRLRTVQPWARTVLSEAVIESSSNHRERGCSFVTPCLPVDRSVQCPGERVATLRGWALCNWTGRRMQFNSARHTLFLPSAASCRDPVSAHGALMSDFTTDIGTKTRKTDHTRNHLSRDLESARTAVCCSSSHHGLPAHMAVVPDRRRSCGCACVDCSMAQAASRPQAPRCGCTSGVETHRTSHGACATAWEPLGSRFPPPGPSCSGQREQHAW